MKRTALQLFEIGTVAPRIAAVALVFIALTHCASDQAIFPQLALAQSPRDPHAERRTHASPAYPRTGGITYLMPRLRAIQRAVDHGNRRYLYHLNPVKVTLHDLPNYGFTGSPIILTRPTRPQPAPTAHHGEDGLPETDVIVRYRSREYWIVLNQFVKHGPGGIWSIITITPM